VKRSDLLQAALGGTDEVWQAVVEQRHPAVAGFVQSTRIARPVVIATAPAPAPAPAPGPAPRSSPQRTVRPAGPAGPSPGRAAVALVRRPPMVAAAVPVAAVRPVGRPAPPAMDTQQAVRELAANVSILTYAHAQCAFSHARRA
jgi:hypothetical protein